MDMRETVGLLWKRECLSWDLTVAVYATWKEIASAAPLALLVFHSIDDEYVRVIPTWCTAEVHSLIILCEAMTYTGWDFLSPTPIRTGGDDAE